MTDRAQQMLFRGVLGKASLALTIVALVLPPFWAAPAYADPPPWAPAHGYRAKKGPKQQPAVVAVPVVPAVGLPRFELSNCNRELVGGLMGAAAGGLVGSQIGKGDGRLAATAGGAVLGLLLGGSIGRSMDQVDQTCVGRALEQAPTGTPVAWRNPDNGRQYQVTPVRTFPTSDGRFCREYTTEVVIGGGIESAHGTACRQPDGTWQKVQ